MKRPLTMTALLNSIMIVALVLPALAGDTRGQDKPVRPETVSAPRVLTAGDTIRINRVSRPVLSPDGKWVLYEQSFRDMDDKDMKSSIQIWRVRTDGTGRRQMTRGETDSTSPVWLPDGTGFAFLSLRGKTAPDGEGGGGPKNQVFFIPFDGGEARQVTNHAEGVQGFSISPDGKKILFSAVDPLTKEEKEKIKIKDDTEIVDAKFRMTHLWTYDIEKNVETRLTEGSFTVTSSDWAPDSRRVAFATLPTPHTNDNWSGDVWVVDLDAKAPRKLIENPGNDVSPRFSPDGKTIAFASIPVAGRNTWHHKLCLVPAGGGSEPRILLKDFDRDFGAPLWSPDGKAVFWSTGNGTSMSLYAADLEKGTVRLIETPRGLNNQWNLSRDGRVWAWVSTTGNWPAEVYAADSSFKKPVRLSDANPWLRDEKVALGAVETVRWKNSDGQWIEGVLTRPVGYEPGKSYPFILNPHGGPTGASMESFNVNAQFFAGNGFMTLQPNFRGSTNYGQEFVNANRNFWGIRDYDDCMTGVDFCIEQGWADPDRMVCNGWSYGGYMSYWIVTQTDRFKAVSPGAGLPDLTSMYGTTDIPGYFEWFFGRPWEEPETYLKHSPIRYVRNVKTPVLIMHGAEDTRVPPSQAEEFYRALRDLGKDVTFVRFPREGHGIREPRHVIDQLNRYLDFFLKHINPQRGNPRP